MHVNTPGAEGAADTATDDTIFDGGALTEQEQAALDAKTEDEQAAIDAQAEADQAEADRIATEDAARIAAEDVAAQAMATEAPGEAPAPPEDFEQARIAADEKFRTGLDDAVDHQREYLRILRAEEQHKAALAAHESAVASHTTATQAAEQSINNQWAADQKTWIAAHPAFMANVVLKTELQNTIHIIERENPGIGNTELLDKAYAQIAETRIVPKEGAAKEGAVMDALKARKSESPGQTLGDVPAARSESFNVNPDFAALDQLPIEDLEDKVAQMTDAQREKWLADAPGATTAGRD